MTLKNVKLNDIKILSLPFCRTQHICILSLVYIYVCVCARACVHAHATMDHQQMVLGVKWLQLDIDMSLRFSAFPSGS